LNDLSDMFPTLPW